MNAKSGKALLEMNVPSDLEFWRLCEELTINQAALLIIGLSPSSTVDVERLKRQQRPEGYEATKSAIREALRKGSIEGTIIPEYSGDGFGSEIELIEGSIHVDSQINVESLKAWLFKRKSQPTFFFPVKNEKPSNTPAYLDPDNPRYSRKLAAAVSAWMAITDSGNRHPKQALSKWLHENAAELKLTGKDRRPLTSAIQQIAKVANWQERGGAPRTPGGRK